MGFKKSLLTSALDESSLSIGRVKEEGVGTESVYVCVVVAATAVGL